MISNKGITKRRHLRKQSSKRHTRKPTRKYRLRKRVHRGGETSNKKEPGTVILVEPRKHKALGFVVKNLMENLGPEWSLILFHGTLNKEWMEEKLQKEWSIYKDRISLHNLNIENLSYPSGYNDLFNSKAFYSNIPTELFIVAQTDSMICPQHKGLLYDFLKYNYVGAPWPEGTPWVISGNFVGNGGFSLRRKSKMLEIIEKFPASGSPNENIYFTSHFSDLPVVIPESNDAKRFSIETVKSSESFGIHAPWKHGIDISEEQCKGYAELKELQGVE